MPTATVVDRHGRRLEPHDEVVPDGATVRVALPFADALSPRTARAFARDAGDKPQVFDALGAPAGFRPGFALARDDFAATTSNQTSQSASEVAREDYCGASALAAGAHADKRPSAGGGTLIGTAGNNARRGVVMRMSGLSSRQPRAAVSARASWHRHRIEAKARQRAAPRVPARGDACRSEMR